MKLEVNIQCNAIIIKNHAHGNEVRSAGRKNICVLSEGIGLKGKIIKDAGNKK